MHFLETQETLDLIRAFGLMWKRVPSGALPLAVKVTLFHLTAAHGVTPNLPRKRVSRLALDRAVDRLNACYGRNTVYFGGAQTALDSAPTRMRLRRFRKWRRSERSGCRWTAESF